MTRPKAPELRRNRMASLGAVVRPLRISLGKSLPIAPLRRQPIDADAPEQDIVGRLVLLVLLEAEALEVLDLVFLITDLFVMIRRQWQAEHLQPTVVAPEGPE